MGCEPKAERNDVTLSVRNGRAARAAVAIALAGGAGFVAGCGDDDESTSAADSSAATSTASTTTSESGETTTTDSTSLGMGAIGDATAALEAEGFDIRLEPAGDLDTITGRAEAGAVATRSGSAGDVLVFEWKTAADAEEYEKANDDDILQTEVVETLTLTSTADNTDLLDQALAAVEG